MVFATRLNLQLLGRIVNVAEAMSAAAKRTPVIVTPHVYVKDGRRMIDIPADAGFGKATWDWATAEGCWRRLKQRAPPCGSPLRNT